MTDGLLVSILFVFTLTFVCFPGLVEDTELRLLDGVPNMVSWWNLLVLSVFNFFDSMGRYLGGVLLASNRVVNTMALARSVFLGTFLWVAFEGGPAWVFGADWFKIANLVLFSFSNGYVSTVCAVKAPQQVKEGDARMQVGGFIGITLSTGIMLGSLLAFAMTLLLEKTP